ncbi:phosphatase PAP2 family protein [Paenibacillus sp. GCM10023252]|uniref:phosphatase PAP2 family protein n=1 Tax=Paenibacillus sp. GCM10023252 TaxID=3252649 RepID=UPI00361DB197
MSVNSGAIVEFDRLVIEQVRQLTSPEVTGLMKRFSVVGSAWFVIILAAATALILQVVLGHRQELLLFAGAIAGSALLNVLLKLWFERARPTLEPIVTAAGYSFPSGHSMGAASFYGILTYLLWRHMSGKTARGLLLAASGVMIVGIGVSRIYLGVHYPSDVVGAYLISFAWLALAVLIFRRMFGKRY